MKRKSIFMFDESGNLSSNYLLEILQDTQVTTLPSLKAIPEEKSQEQLLLSWDSVPAIDILNLTSLKKSTLNKLEKVEYHKNHILEKYLPDTICFQTLDFYFSKKNQSTEKLVNAISVLVSAVFYQQAEGCESQNNSNLAWALSHIPEDEINHRRQNL